MYACYGAFLFLPDLALTGVAGDVLQHPAGSSEDLDGAPASCPCAGQHEQWHSPACLGLAVPLAPEEQSWSPSLLYAVCLLLVVQKLFSWLTVIFQEDLL